MIIIATKKNRKDKIIFYYYGMTKQEALIRAKEEIRNLTKSGKRMYGWKFEVK